MLRMVSEGKPFQIFRDENNENKKCNVHFNDVLLNKMTCVKCYLLKSQIKGDNSECNNWRGITLLSIPSKIPVLSFKE